MIAPRKISQKVSVEIDRYDDGLRRLIRQVARAPQGSSVTFHERGVTIVWHRHRKP